MSTSRAGESAGATLVTGHRGMVGSGLTRRAEAAGDAVLTATRQELDLRDLEAVDRWFGEHKPARVIHAAGTVGGIHANNSRPADFLHDNALLYLTVLRAAWRHGVEKLLYLGSSCIYPRDCPQPIKEEYLLTGPLEPTNDAYAIAKIGGLVACRSYRRQHGCRFVSAMPTNLYGPNDNFSLEGSHVLPALIRKFHDAKVEDARKVTVWGSGKPRREFLHVDDLSEACWVLLERYDDPMTINVGTGEDVSIAELADTVRSIVYPEAEIVYDASKPDGTPRKLLDVSRINDLGWKAKISLPEGIRQTYDWFLEHHGELAAGRV
ncbi:MAG: GDP-L-fucose synthase [Planctomycetota bacterium]